MGSLAGLHKRILPPTEKSFYISHLCEWWSHCRVLRLTSTLWIRLLWLFSSSSSRCLGMANSVGSHACIHYVHAELCWLSFSDPVIMCSSNQATHVFGISVPLSGLWMSPRDNQKNHAHRVCVCLCVCVYFMSQSTEKTSSICWEQINHIIARHRCVSALSLIKSLY